MSILRNIEIIEHDGYTATPYTGYELAHGDVVWLTIPGLDGMGEWATVDEDDIQDRSDTVSARFWGEQYPVAMRRENIKYEMLHSCECGRIGSESWRICHPDA